MNKCKKIKGRYFLLAFAELVCAIAYSDSEISAEIISLIQDFLTLINKLPYKDEILTAFRRADLKAKKETIENAWTAGGADSASSKCLEFLQSSTGLQPMYLKEIESDYYEILNRFFFCQAAKTDCLKKVARGCFALYVSADCILTLIQSKPSPTKASQLEVQPASET
ncbi:hypothetical protein Ciccas_014416 [Cichlidogyrus casuarinus]|uniref:Secreted protein n=1 Tax=Cichlidogyrus casuarinus TaxID=1844966 RepID=A0ABD2PID9_9PLAT